MSHQLRIHRWFALFVVMAFAAQAARAQSLYLVSKSQNYVQTGPTGAVPDPTGGFTFHAQAGVAATLALPSGATQALVADPSAGPGTYDLDRTFATKAAFDVAFPNGTYRMTGPGIPTLNFNLTTEAYPTTTPAVIGGNWNSGGNLVVDPALPTTINFSINSSYSPTGNPGHMEFHINGISDDVSLSTEITSQALFGSQAVPLPFTSYTIPSGRLVSGRVYEAQLFYQVATTADGTTLSGSGVVALWTKGVKFYIAAIAAGTTPQPAPTITAQPANTAGPLGGSATFSVGFPAGSSLGIVQWLFNGQPINGGATQKYVVNGPNLTINNLTQADVGAYSLRAFTTGGVVTSNEAQLTIGTATGPSFTRQPVSQNVTLGDTAVFSAAVATPAGTSYQWRLNGNIIPGATDATLVVQSPGAAQAGAYTVVATNGGGSVTSGAAQLTLSSAVNNPARLINLSILTALSANETMTMGTVLGGAGTSGTKPLLVRAAGPALAQFGVGGFLPDPRMALINAGGATVAANDDWSGEPSLVTAFSSVGAFAYTSPLSRDAALYQSDATALAPGNYTVQVKDAGTGTGAVIAEIYDATPAFLFSSTTPRLINVSVLKQINVEETLTAGFVIGGGAAKTVLIRAVGPSLGTAPFNLSGAMPDPQLTLNSSTANATIVVASNNDWAGDPAIARTAARIGAFAVTNNASRDAMLLVTLAPGNYTAQVKPVAGSAGGVAIVEVYEVP